MTFAETLARWAIIIGFGLLAAVTGLAGTLLVASDQPNQQGNPRLLLAIALVSAAIALFLYGRMRKLKAQAPQE